jgi:uncharacterized protein
MSITPQAPAAQDTTGPLDTSGPTPRLRASRCAACDQTAFPARAKCPRCAGPAEAILLPPTGVLWTWTTQGFPPPSPPYRPAPGEEAFEPYAVGYVEFEGHLRVEGRLTERDFTRLRVGMPLQTVAEDRGASTLAYAFAPIEEDRQA